MPTAEIIPPPAPCTTRAAIMIGIVGAKAAATLAKTNMATAQRNMV